MKWYVIFLCLILGCESVIVEQQAPPNLFYSSQSICDCHTSAMGIMYALIDAEHEIYKTMFKELRYNCLSKYATNLYVPSYCNDPDSLQILLDSLYSMGIDING